MTTENTIDISRLRKLVEWVEEQDALPTVESTWEQEQWVMAPFMLEDCFHELEKEGEDNVPDLIIRQAARHAHGCGTTMCAAGKVVVDEYGEQAIDFIDQRVNLPNGEKPPIKEEAQRLLGLDDHGADDLFFGVNTAKAVRTVAERLAGEKL